MQLSIAEQLTRAREELRDHLSVMRKRLEDEGPYRERAEDTERWCLLRERVAPLEDVESKNQKPTRLFPGSLCRKLD